jgi:hypothetical protein
VEGKQDRPEKSEERDGLGIFLDGCGNTKVRKRFLA